MIGNAPAAVFPRVGITLPGAGDCAINGAAANAAVPAAAAERHWPRVVMAIPCNNVVRMAPASVHAK
ncbi:hypothetical protein ADT25_02835 [Xanthomonas oryzae]|uniref:Uncharacterized protein n=1 Tax=Xanthomonas oryzae TaxID=347 RepID=A0AAP0ZPQ1_9XANT|nr:hypothetical protein ADT25_02835 [Xanthomonas oryzae]